MNLSSEDTLNVPFSMFEDVMDFLGVSKFELLTILQTNDLGTRLRKKLSDALAEAQKKSEEKG